MRKALGLVFALGVTCAPVVARAQADTEEAPGVQAEASPTDTHDDAAWAMYHEAFAALAVGERARATQLLEQLRARHPEHPAAARAAELVETLDRPTQQADGPTVPPGYAEASGYGQPPATPEPVTPPEPEAAAAELEDPLGPEVGTGTARAELVFFQTLHGLGVGAEACVLVECQSVQAWVLMLMAGTGGGFGLSLGLSRDGVRPGLARALSTGTVWGGWNALMLGLATDAFANADEEEKAVALALILGQGAGMGAGAGLFSALEPSAGQVSLTSSGGLWTTLGALWATLLFVDDIDDPSGLFWTLLVASDVGLLAGAYLASEVPMTAGRVLLIDAGGLLGSLLGAGIDLLIEGEDPSRAIAAFTLGGMVAGLATSYFLTRDWDAPEAHAETTPTVGLAPMPGGGMATLVAPF